MDAAALFELLEWPLDRFRTVRAEIHEWIDFPAMHAGLERFRQNPEVVEWIDGDDHRRAPLPVRDRRHRLWLEPPERYRLEWDVHHVRPERIEGLFGEDGWSWTAGDRRVFHSSTRGSVAALVQEGEAPQYHQGDFTVSLHPAFVEPFTPPAFDRLDVLGASTHAGRPAVHAVAAFDDWDERHPLAFEDFPPADDYDLLIDEATGVLLRVACRFDGSEFSVHEMVEVAFDEPLSEELFLPPTRRPK